MVDAADHPRYSFLEYAELEEVSNVKHEFLDGVIIAMAGGSPRHAALAAAFSGLLFPQLRGGDCRVYSSDLRVRVEATGLATYPDVTVVCGALQTDPESPQTVLNPRVVVEVFSASTRAYDRGAKLRHYQRIESLGAVVLVEPDARQVIVVTRADGSWHTTEHGPGDTVTLAGIGASVAVDELYDAVA